MQRTPIIVLSIAGLFVLAALAGTTSASPSTRPWKIAIATNRDSKDSEIMVVLTTNEVSKIHPAFLRPGRIDAVVSIRPPDTEATVRMVRRYGRGLVDASASDEPRRPSASRRSSRRG